MMKIKFLILFLSLAAYTKETLASGVSSTGPEESSTFQERVVLTHGFARTGFFLWRWGVALEKAGFEVCKVKYDSLRKNIDTVKKEAFEKIEKCLENPKDKIHFIGYSFGGLLIRSYLGGNKIKNLGHVISVASPNKGTEFVDHYRNSWWLNLLGKDIVYVFSAKNSEFINSLKPPDYKLGVIAGNINFSIQEHVLPGEDDGIVRVEGTKVEGMTDFIVIQTSHYFFRFNKEAMSQAIHFLKYGEFEKQNL